MMPSPKTLELVLNCLRNTLFDQHIDENSGEYSLATWSATGRLSLIALYNSTSKCVMKQLSVTEDHRFVANRRILECPFDKRSEPTDIKVLVDEETKLMKWVAWTLTTSNHVTLFVAAPKQNLSISYPLKFPAAQLLDFVESKVSTSARVTFGEEGSSNLWFVETAGVNENLRTLISVKVCGSTNPINKLTSRRAEPSVVVLYVQLT
ncbi:hypothetical protein L596_001940 [Steinernema carpocapsae]|uniref:Uncharacterized protein n=1 Tax=Steinernema carpocapsae TaxID=34508 RepID=A0A4U8UPR3_STECR|nr:hypothetical protein L596_001940 [Steinernema carpocapsae]